MYGFTGRLPKHRTAFSPQTETLLNSTSTLGEQTELYCNSVNLWSWLTFFRWVIFNRHNRRYVKWWVTPLCLRFDHVLWFGITNFLFNPHFTCSSELRAVKASMLWWCAIRQHLINSNSETHLNLGLYRATSHGPLSACVFSNYCM